ncbi:uncharacterized protein CTHT_0071930 [Thermochaetoides thermophila DSM 1495]|uniref:Uncharacterized protein n=1 Tax=Chaetomium thermophilum (strain DSM 1495 / CBS 144.50 / IMI 039719) TaxID=759272 RepID=G0SFS3_CHATD|nr:hypothetical protein CTHT_0071930 [Thermochaetoides thermophila DSM 1495]EGS17838.1 hypothetical protein CTHT_0071930 [Thermochaetoides thermophila DSM 1495]
MFCGSVYILWWNIEVHKINVGGDTGPLGVLSVFCGTVVNAYIAVTAFLRKYNLSHIKFALLADFAVASCILGAYLHTFINKEPSWIKWSYIGWKWQRRWKAAEVMLLVPCSLLYAAVVMAFVGFRITRGKREDRRKALHRNNNGNNNDIPMTTIQSNEPEAEVDPEIIDDPPPPYAADPPPYSEAPRQT